MAPAANRAVVPRLSPRMREQVLEHAILQGEHSVLERREEGYGSSATRGMGWGRQTQILHLPGSDRRAKELA